MTALIGLVVMIACILLEFPIAFAMAAVGLVGLAVLTGDWHMAFSMAGTIVHESGSQYLLSVLPLFILMGNFITHAGLSRELYRAAYAFLGHFKGGLSMSTVVACGGFGACCGSSLATAATFSRVAYPEMRELGYSKGLAAGSIASGGTLGIMIPPSVVMVVYAVLTEQSIGKMFIAGILPGIVATLLYMCAVRWVTWRRPEEGPAGKRMFWRERMQTLAKVWGVVLLFVVVMGGIYAGVFTATEASGIGACCAFGFTVARGRMTWKLFSEVLIESTRTTGMLFMILIGALIFANFINFSMLPGLLAQAIEYFSLSPLAVIILICVIYLILGCIVESMSMILLTVPIFYPLVVQMGMDPIWFGIIVVTATEISFITPPVGLNVMLLKNLLPDITMGELFRGVGPFVVADFVRLSILVAFPAISLVLPRYLGLG